MKVLSFDGYDFRFHKKGWIIFREDVSKAVIDFFVNDKLLKSINSAPITLIAKVDNPSSVQDFRPLLHVAQCCTRLWLARMTVGP